MRAAEIGKLGVLAALAREGPFPAAQEKYMCKFGAAPATEAVRISLTEVSQACAFAFALLSFKHASRISEEIPSSRNKDQAKIGMIMVSIANDASKLPTELYAVTACFSSAGSLPVGRALSVPDFSKRDYCTVLQTLRSLPA